MDYFSKQKGMIAAIVVLALINLVTLGSIWYTHRPIDKKRNYRKYSKESIFERKLGLSKEQKVKFRSLKEEHFDQIGPIFKELQKSKKTMFKLVENDLNSPEVQELAEKMADLHKNLELAHFKHFSEMRAVCTGEQKIKFDTLMSHMAIRMYDKKGRGKKYRKRMLRDRN